MNLDQEIPAPQAGEERSMKNLVIGIGGTGLSTIRELRRLIAERYEKGLDDEAVAGVRFAYLDTDANFAATKGTWSVLGKDISLKPGETISISGSKLKPFVENVKDYADIDAWMPSNFDYVGEPGDGAKGIRPFGKLIYQYSENRLRVQEAIAEARSSLNDALPHETNWRIYVVCSLSGGTGSGMFLPLAQDLIDWNVFQRGVREQKMPAFLVLPPLVMSGRHDRYHVNAFAALKELNYLAVKGQNPFTSTYLVEPVSDGGHEVGIDNLPLLIAQRLFLNIQRGPAAGAIDGLLDNPQTNFNSGDDTRKHALCFSSFGLSSVSYPRETIARSVALEWASGAVANWLLERDAPQKVNEAVRNELPLLHLSKLHVDGDGDPFGSLDHPPFIDEIVKMVDVKIDPLGKKQLSAAGHKSQQEIEGGFRGAGIQAFFQQREKDVTRAAEYAMGCVRLAVSRQIRDSARGVRFAKEYLQELRNILEGEFKPEAASRVGESALKQIAIFQSNYSETVNLIAQHEQKYVYFDSEYARDKANMSDELKGYLRRKAGFESGKYAVALLGLVIPAVQKLRDELDVWNGKLSDTLGKLRGKLRREIDGRAGEARENGTVIFDMTLLRKVANEAPKEVVYPALERLVTAKLADLRKAGFDDLDLFALGEQANADQLLEDVAYQYILSAESPLNVRRTTLFDRFLDQYPTPKARQELLSKTAAQSAVFVRTRPAEIDRRPVATVKVSKVSLPDVTGRLTNDGQEAQSAVRQDLLAAGVKQTDILSTNDEERILFVRELQAFPVRFIESVGKLKGLYDKFPVKEVLHLDKRDVPHHYELFLLSEQERRALQEAEETFLLARAQNWIVPNKNLQSQKSEIRYEYEIPNRIGVKAASFGLDWELAFKAFTQDAIAPDNPDANFRDARVRLTERAGAQRQEAKTQPEKWAEMYKAMTALLAQTAESYQARQDDDRYKRDMEIINRIVDRQNA